ALTANRGAGQQQDVGFHVQDHVEVRVHPRCGQGCVAQGRELSGATLAAARSGGAARGGGATGRRRAAGRRRARGCRRAAPGRTLTTAALSAGARTTLPATTATGAKPGKEASLDPLELRHVRRA